MHVVDAASSVELISGGLVHASVRDVDAIVNAASLQGRAPARAGASVQACAAAACLIS